MKEKDKQIIFHISIFTAMILSVIIYGLSHFASGCENVKENVLRLHVIANSDTQEDQELKLKVRDAIIETGAVLFEDCENKNQAAYTAKEKSELIKTVAQEVIKEEGKDYPVSVFVGQENYPTRTYEKATLPAGEYTSLRVIIGEGEGHNWWCVVFPPMCVTAASKEDSLKEVLNSDGMQVVNSDPKYEVRFKLVEWYEGIKEKWENATSDKR